MPKHPQNYLNQSTTSSVLRWSSACILLMIAVLLVAGLLLSRFKQEAVPIAGQADTQTDGLFTRLLDRCIGTDWYGIYLQGNKVGHGKLAMSREKGPDGTIYRLILSGTTRIMSLGEIATIEMGIDAKFDAQPPYALRVYSMKMKSNNDISETTIAKTRNGYKAKIVQANETRTQMLGPLNYTLNHALAVDTWLQRKPKVGDSIKCPDLNPNTLKIEILTSRIKGIHTAVVNGVKIKYYEIVTTDAEGLELAMFYGADGKAYTVNFGGLFIFQLEPKTLAMRLDKPTDLFVNNIVTIDQALGEPDNVVRLQVAIDDISGALISGAPGQTVERDEENKSYIVTLNPKGGCRVKATDEEIKKNLRATTDIPINHPKVMALAQEAVGDAKTTAKKIANLVKFVDEYIEDDYIANPLTVLDIIAKQKGDCSNHADLFTAMARSQGIPCRTVHGLIYLGDEFKGFGQHAWNEVVIDGVWVPVDPTLDQSMIDATHLRFPVNITEEWQVMATIPKMEITVLDVELKE